MSAQSLDLNNLVPEQVEIKISDQTLYMKPPTLRALFVITRLSDKVESDATTPEEVENIRNSLYKELCLLVDGLDAHQLTDGQLIALAGLVAKMSSPEAPKTDETGGKITPDPKVPAA